MTTTLIICRGLPASGKTTRARAWVALDPANRARVNRDDLRAMLHDGLYLGSDTEQRVMAARDTAITTLLNAGVSVVSDDTNLPQQVARHIARLGRSAGADIEVWDITDVPEEVCLRRDAAREHPVGAEVIRNMRSRYLAGKSWPLPAPVDADIEAATPPAQYVPRPGAPRVVMVDLDGTLCLHNGRSPYDESRVLDDLPNHHVIAVVAALVDTGHEPIFCSGRSSDARADSRAWIDLHLPFLDGIYPLYMREAGDKRKDHVVKLELFDRHIRDHFDVVCVLDDRKRVVDAWRSIGLTVLQVAEGDF